MTWNHKEFYNSSMNVTEQMDLTRNASKSQMYWKRMNQDRQVWKKIVSSGKVVMAKLPILNGDDMNGDDDEIYSSIQFFCIIYAHILYYVYHIR